MQTTMGIVVNMTRKEKHMPNDSAETKLRILDAASEEFADSGFAGARIDRIAQNAQANKQLIYRYFGNKHDLYEAVFMELTSRIRRDEDVLNYGKSVFEAMLGLRGADEALTSRMIRTLTWEGLDPYATSEEVLELRRRNYHHALEWVRNEQEAGRIRSEVLAEHVVSLVVVAGGMPYATPNVFEFLFDRMPNDDDREDWRNFILEMLRP